MAFQSIPDIYVMEGTSSYLALALASLDVGVESDSFVKIVSSDPFVIIDSSDPSGQIPGAGVIIAANQSRADVPLIISFNDPTWFGLNVTLLLTLYDKNGTPTGDATTVTLHILDEDNLDRPRDIIVDGNSVIEDATAGTVVATLSTLDPTPGDTFTYLLNGNSNFIVVDNEIRVADGAQFDFQSQPTQFLQVMSRDVLGHSFVKDVTINITSAYVAPILDTSAALDQILDENSSFQIDLTASGFNGALVGITAISGDTGAFSLDQALNVFVSQLNFTLVFNPHNFETPVDVDGNNTYDYTITVADGFQTTTKIFHFTVTNVSPETLNGTIDGNLLIGSDDIEFIFGFSGNDILNGMGGNDVITGGLGKDWMTGGTGADIFNFDLKTETVKGGNRDVIMDFNRVELDQIDLSDIDAKSKTKTFNDHFKFIGAKAFHHKASELHCIKKAGFFLVEGDMDGNGKADFQIEVHGVGLTKLMATDFIL
jgi:Ca2+-binding RTX toxin-like protein